MTQTELIIEKFHDLKLLPLKRFFPYTAQDWIWEPNSKSWQDSQQVLDG